MHTPIKFYVIIPVDLFRGGSPTKPKFDYIRTMPPRKQDQVYDVKIDEKTNEIDHKSGGLSLFHAPDFSFGSDWWIIPGGTPLPHGFTVSKDLSDGKFKGHYTIRALSDVRLDWWKSTLKKWAEEHAIHIKDYQQRKVQ